MSSRERRAGEEPRDDLPKEWRGVDNGGGKGGEVSRLLVGIGRLWLDQPRRLFFVSEGCGDG